MEIIDSSAVGINKTGSNYNPNMDYIFEVCDELTLGSDVKIQASEILLHLQTKTDTLHKRCNSTDNMLYCIVYHASLLSYEMITPTELIKKYEIKKFSLHLKRLIATLEKTGFPWHIIGNNTKQKINFTKKCLTKLGVDGILSVEVLSLVEKITEICESKHARTVASAAIYSVLSVCGKHSSKKLLMEEIVKVCGASPQATKAFLREYKYE